MNIVVLGGGNGTSRLLAALLPLLLDETVTSLHALVSTADDGGSTGMLRAQYGVGSMGDLTKSLMALSPLRGDIRGDELLRALNYRFHEGDFAGHTLRNILLAVFELTRGDIDSAIAIFARLLQIRQPSGVVPTTLKPLRQLVEVEVGGQRSILGEGQHFISHKVNLQIDPAWKPGTVRVTFEEDLPLNPRAEQILKEATHIIVAPGHTYGTILPSLALPAL
ncbi:MAG: 2-phospho-L-lactate transferase CofD family protein, partial [Patescibacteria group bacterium]